MSWLTLTAIFFVAWWLVLFAILPISLRTQDEEGEVTLGTVASAPKGAHMLRAVLRTTVVTAILFAIIVGGSTYFGLGFDSIPQIVPAFE
jgi:predicted secreted protein